MKRIDEFPSHELEGLKYRPGKALPFGARILDDGTVNFSIYSKDATACSLVLYHLGEEEPYLEIPFTEEFRIGSVYCMTVFDLDWENTEYGYRFDGPYDKAKGLVYDKTKVLLDPYAKSVSGRPLWGKEPENQGGFVHRGRIIREDYDWDGDVQLNIPAEDLVIYELHVRSFTKDPSSGVRHAGTFAGLAEKIPYLKELGINCVELLPIFAFDELDNSREYDGKRLLNYWGYSTVGFFAPKTGYAASAPVDLEADELKSMVKKFHKAGIAVFLDVVFNHTAEGDGQGPYISYKGIDNRTYYMLTPDGEYYNFSGCGNTMNCNNAVVRNAILDCLRYWVSDYHIDGFRFDLASILSRDADGKPMNAPPALETLAQDPILSRTKLIAEAWDAGGLYQVGSFPSWNRWSEWNGKFRDSARRFIKSDADALPELVWRIGGSEDLYTGRGPAASINFITCHDGFTLRDLVSYNNKHNEKNGEDNRDGSNDNLSWNCGVEGETSDPKVKSLRSRQMKNMLTLLFTSRGIPMLLSGDEMGNTQFGNNNAYCQDNEISWIDWNCLDEYSGHYQYVENLIAFRRAHPVLRSGRFDTMKNKTGYPELSFHSTIPWEFQAQNPSHTLAYLFAEDHEKYGTPEDCFIYVVFNAHWEGHEFGLPLLPKGRHWHLIMDSGSGYTSKPDQGKKLKERKLYLQPRSSAVLAGY